MDACHTELRGRGRGGDVRKREEERRRGERRGEERGERREERRAMK